MIINNLTSHIKYVFLWVDSTMKRYFKNIRSPYGCQQFLFYAGFLYSKWMLQIQISFRVFLLQKGNVYIDRRPNKIGIFTLTSRTVNILSHQHMVKIQPKKQLIRLHTTLLAIRRSFWHVSLSLIIVISMALAADFKRYTELISAKIVH